MKSVNHAQSCGTIPENIKCSYTPRSPKGEGGILFYLCPSVRPSKIFFVIFFSVTVDSRNLIFGHKRHIGIPYRGKWFFYPSDSYFLFAEEQGYHKWALAHSSSCYYQYSRGVFITKCKIYIQVCVHVV
jgi:hypothetical protein